MSKLKCLCQNCGHHWANIDEKDSVPGTFICAEIFEFTDHHYRNGDALVCTKCHESIIVAREYMVLNPERGVVGLER